MPRAIRMFIVLAAAVVLTGAVDDREAAAIRAADQWLALLDAGKIDETWKGSASLFQKAVSAKQWNASVTSARQPFGKLVSRERLTATLTTSLPGAPPGEYVVIQYRAVFEHKPAIETVTPMQDGGAWKVSGYYIK